MGWRMNLTRAGAVGVLGATAIAGPFIGGWEGNSLTAYLDGGGVPTICNGITKGVKLGDVKTPKECADLFSNELQFYMAFVDEVVTVPMTNERWAAIASFTYNLGPGALKRSTMLKKLNAGDTVGACNEIARWVYIGNKDCRRRENNCYGIVRRREAERKLCLKGTVGEI